MALEVAGGQVALAAVGDLQLVAVGDRASLFHEELYNGEAPRLRCRLEWRLRGLIEVRARQECLRIVGLRVSIIASTWSFCSLVVQQVRISFPSLT